MPAPRKYPAELRDRAVRLVREDGEHGAIARVADRLYINRETLRNWVKADRRVNGHVEFPAGGQVKFPTWPGWGQVVGPPPRVRMR